jgi:mRNA-degrading endonuclease toxin of MazEF toxin-antitoxin module
LKRGDIYLVSLDPASGHEQQDTRPVLVVTQEAFNRFTRVPFIAPITSGDDFARRAGFTIALSGTRTTGVIRCDQVRPIDIVARGGRRLESVSEEIMADVLARISALFE